MKRQSPIATITMQNGKQMVIEIDPSAAPNTAASFIYLAQSGAYNNRAIKRIVPGFVIQPSYNSFDGDSACEYLIKGEFSKNGYDNPLPFTIYTVAMGGDGQHLSSGSDFFITLADCQEKLNGKYAAFGKLIAGQDELHRIEAVSTKKISVDVPGVIVNEPLKPEVIVSITVDTFGQAYPQPIKTTGVLAYNK